MPIKAEADPGASQRHPPPGRRETARRVSAWVMGALYVAAGCAHVASPAGFVSITPDWVPYPREVIFATGLCEIAGGAALAAGPLRRQAGFMLALYAIAVFPANVKHFVDDVPIAGVHLPLWYHIPRLAFQPVLVWWALFAGGVIDWPFSSASQAPPQGR